MRDLEKPVSEVPFARSESCFSLRQQENLVDCPLCSMSDHHKPTWLEREDSSEFAEDHTKACQCALCKLRLCVAQKIQQGPLIVKKVFIESVGGLERLAKVWGPLKGLDERVEKLCEDIADRIVKGKGP